MSYIWIYCIVWIDLNHSQGFIRFDALIVTWFWWSIWQLKCLYYAQLYKTNTTYLSMKLLPSLRFCALDKAIRPFLETLLYNSVKCHWKLQSVFNKLTPIRYKMPNCANVIRIRLLYWTFLQRFIINRLVLFTAITKTVTFYYLDRYGFEHTETGLYSELVL